MNHKAKILIVDDEEVVRRSFTRILDSAHCQVKSVEGGAQAAQAMQDDPADVVLLDLRMPDVDGMTVLRALKQRWPASEVIIVTGDPTIESAKEAVALGAYDYLAKPLGPDQVIEASTAALRHKCWALHSVAGPHQPEFQRSPS
ncbi:response regulator [Ramlibacter sp.]|uniref:response regulator n=1 Tax=Ramlibacter sp. TaxID=1917967 RepID=UPI002C6E244F|nr:response regulator [Ramlibacter sp.]HWI82862.1 response regulator [Ramlibacter sp.]